MVPRARRDQNSTVITVKMMGGRNLEIRTESAVMVRVCVRVGGGGKYHARVNAQQRAVWGEGWVGA